ncbi:MAG: DUF2461 domain-containing protein [Aquirufa sp.]
MPISSSLFSFLTDLKVNNNREWFAQNKSRFDAEKKAFEAVILELIEEFKEFENMDGVQVKDCSYRIYKDVRFSKDKSPYKTWFSASFSEGGRKSGLMDYYLHIEPGNKSFLGGGMYAPTPDQLLKYRQEIDYNAESLKKIIYSPEFVARFGEAEGVSLKNSPKGFEKDHPDLDLIRKKQIFFWQKFSDKEVQNPEFIPHLMQSAKVLKPFLDYLNAAFFDKEY